MGSPARQLRVVVASWIAMASASLFACSLITDVDGLAGSAGDASVIVPEDRALPVDAARPDALDAAIEATTTRFCATIDADLCADFDLGQDAAGGPLFGFDNQALAPLDTSHVDRDTTLSLSPPASFLGTLGANDGGGGALLVRSFGASLQLVTGLEAAFGLYIPEYPPEPITASAVNIGTKSSTSNADVLLLVLTVREGNAAIVVVTTPVVGGAQKITSMPLTRAPAAGTWSRVSYLLSATPPQLTVSLDGQVALNVALDPLPKERDVVFALGPLNTDSVQVAASRKFRYDDVVVRVH
jgi:hypothetical protein